MSDDYFAIPEGNFEDLIVNTLIDAKKRLEGDRKEFEEKLAKELKYWKWCIWESAKEGKTKTDLGFYNNDSKVINYGRLLEWLKNNKTWEGMELTHTVIENEPEDYYSQNLPCAEQGVRVTARVMSKTC